MQSVSQILKKAVYILAESKNSNTPVLDAELLLVYVLNQSGMDFDRIKLTTKCQYLLEEKIVEGYMKLIDERSKGKPVQYITNVQEFMGIKLYVRSGVLIPRADTETVAEKAIKLAKDIEKPIIIDMCTGSGAIAVSLAMNLPAAAVWAADISESALECCSINIDRYKLENKVRVVKSDLFSDITDEELQGNVDFIVSNPPYIETKTIEELCVNVRNYEPYLALDGGKDGLVYYRRIVKDSIGFLKSSGILVFEVGYDQGVKVKKIMEEIGQYVDINIEKDLSGYDRCVWGRKK